MESPHLRAWFSAACAAGVLVRLRRGRDERCTCVIVAGSLVSMKQRGEPHKEMRIRFDETILSI
jgi:hypothetical protein